LRHQICGDRLLVTKAAGRLKDPDEQSGIVG